MFDGLVCDLDGVVYRLDEPIPGAPDALNELERRGVKVLFCTNNARSTPQDFTRKLIGMGVRVDQDAILTSPIVTAEELARRGAEGRTALVVGEEGVRASLSEIGMQIVESGDADYVVVGLDTSFDYQKLTAAADAVRAGARLIGTNDDSTLPVPGGVRPGAGAILASIETASGARAEVMGKPHPPMMEAASRRLRGCERIAIVGDRPETDLAGGADRGWMTILVTSGVTTDVDAAEVRPKPDLVVPALPALLEL
jgi:HAD superfamily hydrolase (TIGR01457 family)